MGHEFARFKDAHFTGLRIPDGSGFAVVIGESTKPANFYAPAGGEAFGHDVDDCLDGQIHIAAVELVQLVGHPLDEF